MLSHCDRSPLAFRTARLIGGTLFLHMILFVQWLLPLYELVNFRLWTLTVLRAPKETIVLFTICRILCIDVILLKLWALLELLISDLIDFRNWVLSGTDLLAEFIF